MNAKQICRVLVVLGCCMLLLGLAVQLPANASPVKQSISIPDLLLPWASNISASITSGPHSFGQGFQFSAKYAIGAGSGLDFANGTNFLVLSMASGTVIDIKSNLNGSFGNQVAVKHDVGGSVMIYGHLSEISPAISEGYHILRGQPLGRVGRSTPGHLETENMGAHLHIEFRDGGTCTFPVINGVNNCMSNPDFGNPIDWGSGIPVDGYRFYGYYDVDADLVETAGYNYDGSMVLGDWKTFFEFPYLDEGVRKKVFARVGVNFNCDKSSNTCENEAVDPNTSFATVTYDTSTTQYPAPGEGIALVSSNSMQGGAVPTFTPTSEGGQTGNSHVDLFENTNFGGTQYGWDTPTSGWRNLSPEVNYMDNQVSSIQLDGDWSIMVAQDQNGGGGRKCFVTSHPDLSSAYYDNGVAITDTISSLVVYNNGSCDGQYTGVSAGDQVTLYVDINYTNTQYGLHDAITLNLPDYLTNNASSVGIASGWSVLVHDQNDGQGGSACLIQSDPDLRDNYYDNGSVIHDSINSIRLFNNSNCNGWVSATPTLTHTPTFTPTATLTATPVWSNANLAPNPSFETLDGNNWAVSWHNDAGSVVIDANGQGSDQIHSLYFTANASGAHATSDKFNVLPNMTYEWRQFVKTTSGSGEFGFYVDEYDANDNWLTSSQYKGSIVAGDFVGWATYPHTTSAQTAKVDLQYIYVPNTTFEVYVDSVVFTSTAQPTITPVPSDTPVPTSTYTPTPGPTSTPTPTETPSPSPTPTLTPTPVPTNLIANPGFETLDGIGFAVSWSKDAVTTVSIDTNGQGNEGTNSLYFAPDTVETHAFSDFIPVTYGYSYTLSQYVRTTNQVGELGFIIDTYDANQNWLNWYWIDQVWENVNGVVSLDPFAIPSADVAYIKVQYVFAPNYTMEAWVDSVSFMQAS